MNVTAKEESSSQNMQPNNIVPATDKGLVTKRLVLYIGITFILTYLLDFLLVYPMVKSISAGTQAIGQLLISVTMFMPAVGVLLTRLLTKEGFKNSYIVPQNGIRSIPYFLFGCFGPAILTILGAAVYFLVFPNKFDSGMGYLAIVMAASGVEPTPMLLWISAISQLVSGILLSPIVNGIFCFGEEWGWRGYMLPKMQEKMSMLPTLFISGIIWGLWHAPLTAIGHNYGTGYAGYPFTGILAMCIFCITIGIIFSYITIRTGSCLPAVLAHGSLNGFASAGLIFTDGSAVNPFIGPIPTGIIGGCAFLICAIVMAIKLVKKSK